MHPLIHRVRIFHQMVLQSHGQLQDKCEFHLEYQDHLKKSKTHLHSQLGSLGQTLQFAFFS